jgi:hypothetical protein
VPCLLWCGSLECRGTHSICVGRPAITKASCAAG